MKTSPQMTNALSCRYHFFHPDRPATEDDMKEIGQLVAAAATEAGYQVHLGVLQLGMGQREALPTFDDGTPQNLAAAALDALEWLRFWRDYLERGHPRLRGAIWDDAQARLGRAVAALEQFLPVQPPVGNLPPVIEEADIL